MFPSKKNSELTSPTQEEELEEMDEKPDVVQDEISNNSIETSEIKYEAAQPESSGQHKQENPPLSSNRCRNVFKESVKLAAQKARAGRTSKSIPQSSGSFLKSYHRPGINEPDKNRTVSSDPKDEHFSSENVSRVSSGKRKSSVNMKKSLDASEDLSVRAGPSGIRPRSRKQVGKKEYVCPICNEEFEESHDFDVHFDINHREEVFPCNTGTKASAPKKNLQKYKMDTKKVFVCDICEEKFPTKRALNSHRQSHSDEKPFVCDVCTKGFTRKSDFNRHYRVHSGEKPFVCTVCTRGFTLKSHLNTHYRTHASEKPFACSGKKPYACDVCKKEFALKHHFDNHHRKHTDEKPYVCEVCEKQFSTVGSRRNHYRTHTGEKPFACSVCNKRFLTSSQRARHEQSHSGKKPYECSVCGKTFTRKDNCDKHYKSKHK